LLLAGSDDQIAGPRLSLHPNLRVPRAIQRTATCTRARARAQSIFRR
jgi:hypothetical protein